MYSISLSYAVTTIVGACLDLLQLGIFAFSWFGLSRLIWKTQLILRFVKVGVCIKHCPHIVQFRVASRITSLTLCGLFANSWTVRVGTWSSLGRILCIRCGISLNQPTFFYLLYSFINMSLCNFHFLVPFTSELVNGKVFFFVCEGYNIGHHEPLPPTIHERTCKL